MAKDTNEVWLSRKQSAWLSKLSIDRFDAALRPLVGRTRKAGRVVELNGQDVVDVICSHRAEQGTADPLLSGNGDSPNLERYRAARAALAEHELESVQGTHVNVNDLTGLLLRFSSAIRRGGEVLQRRFGNEAAEILAEAIDDAERVLKDLNEPVATTI